MTSVPDDLRLFEKKFSILQEISNALVATDNLSAIANLMLDLAINYTRAEKGSLMLVNERDELYILAGRGIDLNLVRTYRAKIGEGIAGVVAKNRTPVLVEDLANEPRFKGITRDRYRTNSFASCPIISKNRLLGVLNINDKADGAPFNEDEFSLIKIIANQAAIAMENAILVGQLRFKAAEQEGINRKLIESDVVKTEFITRVSHELRTPLNSIKGSVYYLRQSERLSRREQEEFFDIISGETDKLIGIVENQLDFLRFEDETMLINKTLVSLREVLNEVCGSKNIKTLFARKDISIDVEIGDGLSDVVGDRIRIVQFFLNILEGLSYFLERGDVVLISARENDDIHVSIELPRRLPDSITPYLFSSNHMFQTDSPDEKLKLYLARKVVDIHRWDLVAENTATGLLVSLIIPKSARQKVDAVVNTTLDMFLEFIAEVLDVNMCSVMLCDDMTGDLMIKGARGLDDHMIKQTRVRMGDRIAGWVALEGEPLFIEDIEQDPRFGRKSVPQYNSKSLISLPLKVGGKVIGVLNLNNKRSASPFTGRDFDLAQAMCERVAYFMGRVHGGDHQGDEFRQLMTSFDSLITAEKKYHKKDPRLPDIAMGIAAQIGLGEEERRSILFASVLYDLGLVLLEESILNKKGKLLPSEEHTLKIHPYTTVGLLDSFEFSEEIKRGILHHHERYDGTGYPDGLKGDEIPLISRILSVVDAFCAMTSERPYRPRMATADALAEVRTHAGTLYDPKVVEALDFVVGQGVG
ncbi:GAF domain-containing protein [Geobacter hydrogenophilus]|uniref:histidine kinase n=1 Tax=Geobacter hydrogenophilus TaxID=40983 RepID=A0A9W6G2N5_9BACT|nr:GAF domain-containing protein [Geobacter hydrogenophilus]MBT0892946.1 GAF domain-containing protein [Geobacter hydrogenophilus]GLI39218.1 histidine kinase [Geobacter hydrogenophilus]